MNITAYPTEVNKFLRCELNCPGSRCRVKTHIYTQCLLEIGCTVPLSLSDRHKSNRILGNINLDVSSLPYYLLSSSFSSSFIIVVLILPSAFNSDRYEHKKLVIQRELFTVVQYGIPSSSAVV